MNLETSAIIEAIKSGSDRVMIKLYERYRNPFLHWCTNRHQINTEQAKDIFQDCMLILFRNIQDGKLDDLQSSLKTYLYGIAKNKIREIWKSPAMHSIDHIENPTWVNAPAQEEVENHDHRIRLIAQIMAKLKPACREILTMFYYHQFDMETIAIRLGYKNSFVVKKKRHECMAFLEARVLKSINKAQL